MAPFLPLLSLHKSENVRIGRGVGNSIPPSLTMFDQETNPQTNMLTHAFYADLGQSLVRRDIQHHSAIGAVLPVGTVTNTFSDLFVVSGLGVTAGTGLTLDVAPGTIQSRMFGGQLASSGGVLTPSPPSSTLSRIDLVYVGPDGNVHVAGGPYLGNTNPRPPTYNLLYVAQSGATAGTFTLSFTYNNTSYTTAAIAYNAAASAVASAILAAIGTYPASSFNVVDNGTLGTSPVVLLAQNGLSGQFNNLTVNTAGLTGGTVTAFVGAPPTFGGSVLPLAFVYVPANAASSSAYTIIGYTLTS